MKQRQNKVEPIFGWMLLFIAFGLFCLQIAYLLVHDRFQIEYIDNRLFYIFNILIVIGLSLGFMLLFTFTRTVKAIGAGVLGVFLVANVVLLIQSAQQSQSILRLSPDNQHTFLIKKNMDRQEATYYRVHYGILARPKEVLPSHISDHYHVKWLEEDVAAFTYETTKHQVQQFIGTYGDRKNGLSYYEVGAEIHGEWQGDNVHITSDPEGIEVTKGNQTTLFEWENIHQFGTLAIVLHQDHEAIWTISLNQDFQVHSDAQEPTTGSITLYQATMDKEEDLYHLHYISPDS